MNHVQEMLKRECWIVECLPWNHQLAAAYWIWMPTEYRAGSDWCGKPGRRWRSWRHPPEPDRGWRPTARRRRRAGQFRPASAPCAASARPSSSTTAAGIYSSHSSLPADGDRWWPSPATPSRAPAALTWSSAPSCPSSSTTDAISEACKQIKHTI